MQVAREGRANNQRCLCPGCSAAAGTDTEPEMAGMSLGGRVVRHRDRHRSEENRAARAGADENIDRLWSPGPARCSLSDCAARTAQDPSTRTPRNVQTARPGPDRAWPHRLPAAACLRRALAQAMSSFRSFRFGCRTGGSAFIFFGADVSAPSAISLSGSERAKGACACVPAFAPTREYRRIRVDACCQPHLH